LSGMRKRRHCNSSTVVCTSRCRTLPTRKPGVYVLTAVSTNGAFGKLLGRPGHWWFVVSDIDLSTLPAPMACMSSHARSPPPPAGAGCRAFERTKRRSWLPRNRCRTNPL
jgi:hypothetical protein